MTWAVDPEERARRDRIRIKLFIAILTTYGYALLAGSLWQPLSGGVELSVGNILLVTLGLVFTHLHSILRREVSHERLRHRNASFGRER